MIVQKYKDMLSGKSVIRQLSEFATARGAEIGYENVFDYSLGNPSVPVPQEFTDRMIHMLATQNPMALHGYSPSLGITSVREAIANSLSERFGVPYKAEHIFMASGAAGAIAHAVRLIAEPGDEIITFAPYFPEYNPYINHSGAVLKIVPPQCEDFQINFEAFEEMINEKTMAVLINTPNNPTGVVYSKETIQRLADTLRRKQEEYGHDIFIISDEPYREILFDGVENPCVSAFYENSIMCYSFSKSLSIPGERIGYIMVSPRCADHGAVYEAVCGAGRALGFVCAPSLFQYMIPHILGKVSDLSVYNENRRLLYSALTDIGYTAVKPDGAFYLFVKSPEANAKAFCERARKYELLLVPSDSFGCGGYVRISYCVRTEQIKRSIPAFRALWESYNN